MGELKKTSNKKAKKKKANESKIHNVVGKPKSILSARDVKLSKGGRINKVKHRRK